MNDPTDLDRTTAVQVVVTAALSGLSPSPPSSLAGEGALSVCGGGPGCIALSWYTLPFRALHCRFTVLSEMSVR